uniref:Reverse transcriptase domain-containing protein n=1 Tax=Lygus hesperus TaxID=30085 RepID=A0A0K8TAQ0_LYGHE
MGRANTEVAVVPHPEDSALECIVRTFRPGKAPGPDRIEVRMLQKACPLVSSWYGVIIRKVLELGYFPKEWKKGRVFVLRKPGNIDPADPKAYRPLCLLGYPSKLLERVMVAELESQLRMGVNAQHSFRKGRSTTSAILELQWAVQEAPDKYVLGIFVDIRGAFDNVWWPAVMGDLGMRGCNPFVHNLLLSYFEDREVIYEEGNRKAKRLITKGCPQGSVLEPQLWNVLSDTVITALEAWDVEMVAYADDLVIIVKGASRLIIERKAIEVVAELVDRCSGLKMEIASNKTVMMLLKGRLIGGTLSSGSKEKDWLMLRASSIWV